MADEEPLLPAADDSAPPPPPPTPSWRIGAAFWILGLCNNLPYVVMLSAARDLLEPRPGEEPRNRSRHDCDPVGTGAVLLADVVPALGVKLLLTAAAPAGASPARQVSRGGRGPEPVGQRQRRGRGQRDPEQPGGDRSGQCGGGAGRGHLPDLGLLLLQLRPLLLVVGDGRGRAGRGSGVLGAAGAAAPPPRAAARPGPAPGHAAQRPVPHAAAPVPGRRLPLALVPALPPPAPPLAAGPGPGAAGRVPIGCRSCQSPPALAGRGRSAGGGGGAGGGGAYGNAFLNLSDQVSPPQQPLAVAVVTLMSEVAIAVAGGVALGAHAAFCGQE
ncbi:battenin isoform X4 [Poecile atricapillus]|uniref:battenin isoform X4 n=1 Tax=Poecile atricapillus TaxID=48891 RepID=UPI002738A6E6|nr:battenin isoform X4 [Poecile atricapillus]